jgi:hypothetical protein
MGAYERQTLSPAMLLVTTAADEFNYANAGVSLREAINSANGNPGGDVITFAAGLSGETIMLNGTELAIGGEALTIDARPLATNLTIDANQYSRIFHILSTQGNYTIAGLTLTGGKTTGDNRLGSTQFDGGAIRSLTAAVLTLDESIVSGNSTTGDHADGGAIRAAGTVVLTRTTVSGNSTAGDSANGGGIFSNNDVTLLESTVSGNSTAGIDSDGGGIRIQLGSLTATLSTISNNSVAFGGGGGVWAAGNVSITRSTISGNSAALRRGGGIFVSGATTLTNSTLTNNSTVGGFADGGGLAAQGAVTIVGSTITDNNATQATGGGVHQLIDQPFSISGSIVARNTAGSGDADVARNPGSVFTVNYSMVGTGVTSPGGTNLIQDNPPIGPLADNGGSVLTRAILPGLPGSVLIDAGNPAITFNRTEYDNRGAEYVRAFDGGGTPGAQIDIGAYEFITSDGLSVLFGDYDRNMIVETADYVLWRNTLAAGGAAFAGADGDGDGMVDQDDYPIWRRNFGRTLPPAAAAMAESGAEAPVDVVQTATLSITTGIDRPSHLPATSSDTSEVRTGAVTDSGRPVVEAILFDSRPEVSKRATPAHSSQLSGHANLLLASLAVTPERKELANAGFDRNVATSRAANTLLAAIDEVFSCVGRGVRAEIVGR